jgi:hypothetical protein
MNSILTKDEKLKMSDEQSHYLDWVNGKEPFSLVHWVSDDPAPECNFCWGEHVYCVISKMISTEIWPPLINDRPMNIGLNCIQQYVRVNPKYITHQVLIQYINSDVADIINQYL